MCMPSHTLEVPQLSSKKFDNNQRKKNLGTHPISQHAEGRLDCEWWATTQSTILASCEIV